MGSITTKILCWETLAQNVSEYVHRTGILARAHQISQWQQTTCQGDAKCSEALCPYVASPARRAGKAFQSLLETRGCPHCTLCLTAWKG